MKKNIVITGASTGFGKLTVQTLAKDGHKVFATMRGVEGKNKEYANDIKNWALQHKLDVHVVELDVTSDTSVNEAAKKILAEAGQIDVVVNNAGVYSGGIDETFSVQDYKNIFDVNVFGVLRVNRAFLPSMRQHSNGLFVQISSLMGRFVIPFSAVYTSSKWAVEAIAESLRYELAPLGIDSVIVQPGAFPTEIFSKVYEPENQQIIAEYGASVPHLQNFMGAFKNMMSGEIPNHPQHVADAIKKLIDTPTGKRPLRTAVDKMMPETAQPINEVQQKIQESFLSNMGLSELLQIKESGVPA